MSDKLICLDGAQKRMKKMNKVGLAIIYVLITLFLFLFCGCKHTQVIESTPVSVTSGKELRAGSDLVETMYVIVEEIEKDGADPADKKVVFLRKCLDIVQRITGVGMEIERTSAALKLEALRLQGISDILAQNAKDMQDQFDAKDAIIRELNDRIKEFESNHEVFAWTILGLAGGACAVITVIACIYMGVKTGKWFALILGIPWVGTMFGMFYKFYAPAVWAGFGIVIVSIGGAIGIMYIIRYLNKKYEQEKEEKEVVLSELPASKVAAVEMKLEAVRKPRK
jgi:hypothetical protein